jgi:hypothetical protein
MVALSSLWLPIVLAAVVVFIASFLAWVVLPHHKKDWIGIPDEGGFIDAMRNINVPPGQYIFPFCPDPSALKDPEKKARWEQGPYGTLTVWAGKPNMPRNLILTFLFFLLANVFVAYLASRTVPMTAEYLDVFRVTGVAAILAYCFAFIPNAIWFGRSLRSVVTDVIDGVIYGLLTAGIFAWLWPEPETPITALLN